MGLLDFQMPGMDTPEGQGLLSAAFSLMRAQKYPGQKGALAGALGDAGQTYLQTSNQSRDQLQRRKYLDAQMEAQQMQLEAARRAQADKERMEAAIRNQFAPQTPLGALQGGGGPTVANAQRIGQTPQFDPRRLLAEGGVGALEQGLKINSALNPRPEYKAYKPGDVIFKDGDMSNPVFSVPEKPEALPSAVREYQFAVGQGYQGTFDQWNKDTKKAGAPSVSNNVSVNTEKSLLNSVAGGLGKQLDDGLANAKAAVSSIGTAQRLKAAVDSGKLVSGPGASFRVLGLQLGQMLGVGGKDGAEILANTRTAIQSMAQAELDAAQQMKGQGQITEAERSIIKRAAAGDINDLTGPEIRLLAETMEKIGRFKLANHQSNVQSLGKLPGAAPLMPFYQVEAPAPYQAPNATPGAVRRYNPQTGKIE